MNDQENLICIERNSSSDHGIANQGADHVENDEKNLSASNTVRVSHAFKAYNGSKDPNQIFQDLNMTVVKGSIYGLLGASGCGKTTLLSCIVGRRHLDSGEILVLGGKPGTKGSGVPGKKVGYMPQEMALFGEFTIRETMLYFGWIFGMETKEVDEKMNFLLKFLDLPLQKRFVKNLSGGQQRRVSFAAALIHDPELLILDEPTVGVDPLLRQNIWKHLVHLTQKENKTVIITTHYIEEARQAQRIGLLRDGRLLAEESPHNLLTHYYCSTLEEVFLKLSKNQEIKSFVKDKENHIIKHSHNGQDNTVEETRNISPFSLNFTSKGKLRALLKKNILRMWRNIGMMMVVFALPVIQINLFCLSIGRDPMNLTLAVVNDEIEWNKTCLDVNMWLGSVSCYYLNQLNFETIITEYYETVELANESVKKGNAWGTMHITRNFTWNLLVQNENNAHNLSDIHVSLDMSNQQIGLFLTRTIHSSFQSFLKNLSATYHLDIELPHEPITFFDPVYGSENTTYMNFIAPGIILSIIFFLSLSLTSTALISEQTEGLLDRSWVAGVYSGEILFVHIVTQFVVMCVQTALIYVFVIFVYGIECNGDIGWVVVLTLLQGLCGMCYGFFISTICKQERDATQLALGSFYPSLLLSGIIWPEEGMPMILRYISRGLPLTLATSSMRSMMTRGWSITQCGVYIGFIATITWIVLFLLMSKIVLKFKHF